MSNDILKLVNGESGPFFEDEKSFFGRKRVDSSMKDAKMETDCGGMIITKAKITYGEADAIAASVDLEDVFKSLDNLPLNSPSKDATYIGQIWSPICTYLKENRLIEIDGNYNNSMEYLYDEILKRLAASGYFEDVAGNRRYFRKIK